MEITVLAFGQLAEHLGSSFVVNNVNDTDELMHFLLKEYPSIAGIPFKIAINKNIVSSNTVLDATVHVALLPPFSGG